MLEPGYMPSTLIPESMPLTSASHSNLSGLGYRAGAVKVLAMSPTLKLCRGSMTWWVWNRSAHRALGTQEEELAQGWGSERLSEENDD